MDGKLRIAVLASTNGTILPAIIEKTADIADFVVLLTDREHCGAREKANRYRIKTRFLSAKAKKREEWDQEAVEMLRPYRPDLVILVGFMRILSPVFVSAFRQKILNVHPSLLPKFGGGTDKNVHQAVLGAGETESGATIHYVTDDLDNGPIFLQQSVKIRPNETVDTLKAKVQAVEGELFARAIREFANGYLGT